MKYPVFALFALSLILMASCQNSPTTPATPDATAPAADPAVVDALNKQIQYDFYEGRAVSYKFTTQYKETTILVKNMKGAFSTLSEADRAHIRKIHEGMIPFMDLYEEHRRCTDNLDSLSINLSAGKVTAGDAQKEHATLKSTMQAAGEKLPAALANFNLPALKAEYEGIFSSANKKAEGGN